MNNRLEGGSGPIRGRDFGITNVPDLKVTTTGGRRGGIPLPGKPEVGRPEKGQKKESTPIRRIVGRALLAASAVGIGAGIFETYQNVPQVNEAIHRIVPGLGNNEAPTTFDNTAEKGVIGPNNTTALSLTEINEQFPDQIKTADGKSISFMLPFDLGDNSASYTKETSRAGGRQEAANEALDNGIKNGMILTLPNDKEIRVPFTSNVFLPKGRSELRQNQDKTYGAIMFVYDAQSNTTFKVWIFNGSTIGNPPKAVGFEPIAPLDSAPMDTWIDEGWEKLPEYKRGSPIMKTSVENQKVVITVQAFVGRNVGPTAVSKHMDFLPNLDFFQDQNGKLIAATATSEANGLQK